MVQCPSKPTPRWYVRQSTILSRRMTMMTETFICCHCGQTHLLESRVLVGDDALCERCANEETVICTHCGERIYRDDNAGDENTPLCQPCYDRHYTSCERCGRIIHVDDAY